MSQIQWCFQTNWPHPDSNGQHSRSPSIRAKLHTPQLTLPPARARGRRCQTNINMKHCIHSKHFFWSPFDHLHSFQKNFLELCNSVCPRDASKTKQHVGKRWKLSTEQWGATPQEDLLPFIFLVACSGVKPNTGDQLWSSIAVQHGPCWERNTRTMLPYQSSVHPTASTHHYVSFNL